jgi:hypothetical protein
MTPVNLNTVKQRLTMLKNPPKFPIKGKGFKRIELTDDLEIIKFVESIPENLNVTTLSKREVINKFGKLGFHKYVICSPEFYSLFE